MKINQRLLSPIKIFIYLGFILCVFTFSKYAQLNPVSFIPSALQLKDTTLTEEQKRLPENALKGLRVAPGLEVRPFATEPMLQNPTNIDVDEKGRVWVTEAYNYRPAITKNPANLLGDRIMILEDLNGDGKADTAKVFYQGSDLNAPLGICVLGNKVIVSQSPYVWVFYDDNGDDKADRKEILFSGIGGEQHDHAVHAFTFGMDGKLYFNMGNEGKTLKDKNGKDVLDQDGDVIGPKKYQQGMVFRCNTDGSEVECLANNFRNPYEVAVDSYGTLWQSDNDDDGNKGVRINYVMQYGNYGFKDELTGAGWQKNRVNIEDSIPLRHWHLNDPGEVPNLLQTGAGSPTGLIVYEGSLLPAQFQNQMIHCDAGPNVVRAYPVKKNGAGYSASIVNVVKGENDQWFRPSDVCVAPDGSLIIADWYDPGVGGHQAGDQVRGRIYRVAPPASKYKIPIYDYKSAAGAVAALQNPNLSVRHHAFTVLKKMGTAATPELEKCWNSSPNPRMKARAFWALVNQSNADANKYIQQALRSTDPNLRIIGIRASKQLGVGVMEAIRFLVKDADPQVRRECAVTLRHNNSPEAAVLWASLAAQHDGKDRWYLEALGIGAAGQWDRFFDTYLTMVKNPLLTAGTRDIVWRARSSVSLPYLASLAVDNKETFKNRARYFRAFDFNEGADKSDLLLKMIANNTSHDLALNRVVLSTLDVASVTGSPLAQNALTEVLQSLYGTDQYIELVSKYEVKSQCENLLKLSTQVLARTVNKNAATLLLQLCGTDPISKVMNGNDLEQQKGLLAVLGLVGTTESIDLIQGIVLSDKNSLPLRKIAASTIGRSRTGETRAMQLLKNKKVPASLVSDIVFSVSGSTRESVRKEAATYLPAQAIKEGEKKEPTMADLQALKGNVVAGKKVFSSACILCHKVNLEGNDYGPNLSEIGAKLPKISLLDAIVHPSAGISFGYEGWEVEMKDGATVTGIVTSKTDSDMELKFPGGGKMTIKTNNIKSLNQVSQSMMTANLHQQMSAQDMANLLEYLSVLKKK